MSTMSRHRAEKIIEAIDKIEAEFPDYVFDYKNAHEFEFFLRSDKNSLLCTLQDNRKNGKTRWCVSNTVLDIRSYGHDAKTAMHRFGVELARLAQAYSDMSTTLVRYEPTPEPPKPKPKPVEYDTYCREKVGCSCPKCRGIIPGLG